MITLLIGFIGYTCNALGYNFIEDDGDLLTAYLCELFLETAAFGIYMIVRKA